jgi:hypothetical protein
MKAASKYFPGSDTILPFGGTGRPPVAPYRIVSDDNYSVPMIPRMAILIIPVAAGVPAGRMEERSETYFFERGPEKAIGNIFLESLGLEKTKG